METLRDILVSVRSWWLLVVTACGRIDFVPLTDAAGATDDGPIDAPPLGDLVLHYTMDTIGGGVLLDASGYGHDAACQTCPAPAAGMRNMALRFDGIDDLLTAPSSSVIESLTTYTIAFWMQRDAPPSSGAGCLVSKRYGPMDGNTFQICDHSTNRLFFSSYNGATNTEYYDSSGILLDAGWHHVAVTYDGTMEHLFVDAVEHEAAATMKYFDNGPIVIGADIDNGAALVEYDGVLDDIRIYKRVLTAAEISAL